MTMARSARNTASVSECVTKRTVSCGVWEITQTFVESLSRQLVERERFVEQEQRYSVTTPGQ
jgi:hypothetical protein